MTPKEKAEELIMKFKSAESQDGYNDVRDIHAAIRCALIAVSEILSSGVDVDYYFDKSVGYMISYVEYYQEVKQELEKL
jgi:hypothetical protein